MAEELCNHCGAPRVAGYASCKFCKTPFVQNTQTGAIPCPRCNTLNEMGVQRCVQCQAWVVVQCVFCHALSPHNAPGCLKCGEAFAGAPQRLQERMRQQHVEQGLHIAGTVGNVAASFLGAAAGAGMFSHHEGYEHHHGYHEGYHHHHEYEGGGGAGIAAVAAGAAGGGILGSLFGSSSESSGEAAAAEASESSGGFFDSVFGGSSDDSTTSSDDSGGSDDGGFFGGGDDDS